MNATIISEGNMEQQKVTNSIGAAVVSLLTMLLSFFAKYGTTIAVIVSIVAGIYSIVCAHTARQANKKRIELLNEQLKLMAKRQELSEAAVREAMRD